MTILAISDSSLKPFKCLIIGHASAGVLVVQRYSITLASFPPNSVLLHYQSEHIYPNSIENRFNEVMVHLH